MRKISKTGVSLSVIFLALTVFLEIRLLDCSQPLYYCINMIPGIPWTFFLEGTFGFLFSVILNTVIFYSIGVYIDKIRNNSHIKQRIVTVFIFLIHFVVSVIFLLLGWVSVSFSSGYGTEISLIAQRAIPIGIIIMVMNFIILIKNSFGANLGIFVITFTAIIMWMVGEASMDMQWVLLVYVLLMTPLLVTRYRLKGIGTSS